MKKLFLPLLASFLLVSCANNQPNQSSSAPTSTLESSLEPSIDPNALYGGYYANLVSWTNGEDLKQQLHNIIHGGTYQPIEYNHNSTSNWLSNKDADRSLDDFAFVDAVYSGTNISMDLTNTNWQREHAFCASLMTGSLTGNAVKTLGRATDFHNLFAGTTNGNTSRGNKNFGNANKAADTYQNRLDVNQDGYSFDSKNFEPSDHDKGRLARAIFYMGTMYCEEEYDAANDVTMKPLQIVDGYVDYVAGDDCAFAHGNLSDLLQWANTFDVDLLEYQHNESVYTFVPELSSDPTKNHAQGNRNPYIDFPGLVDYVYGSKKEQAGKLEDVASSYELLHKNEEGTERYAIKDAKRKYFQGDGILKSDIHVVAVDHQGNMTDFDEFTIKDRTFGNPLPYTGNYEIIVQTPLNSISYNIDVVAEDPLVSAQYKHNVTAKRVGDDFADCHNEPGVVHTLNLSGVEWDTYYAQGSVQSNSTALGCKFGKAGEAVGTLRFVTHSAFIYQGMTRILGVYVSGSTASGYSYPIKIKVGDTNLTSSSMRYIDGSTPCEVYAKPSTPLEGVISIEITNITNAVYIKTIAIVLEDVA